MKIVYTIGLHSIGGTVCNRSGNSGVMLREAQVRDQVFHVFICLFISLFMYLFIYVFISLFMYVCIYLFIYLFMVY
jgi:hypothetical protein